MKPLAVVPTYVTDPADVEVLEVCLRTMAATADCDVLVIDDGSPAPELVDDIAALRSGLPFSFTAKDENEGFSKTVNVGLAVAREQGRDAVLVNADIEFREEGWLERALAQERLDGEGPAWVVGGLLTYANGLIQHGGIYFSNLHRTFEHAFKYAPAGLPEARFARRGPVTGALQLIRHEALTEVGLYDEGFELGWEDVDYCIRVFMASEECVMQPHVRAIHHESFFRGAHRPNEAIAERTRRSWLYFLQKYAQTNFAEWVPSL